MLSSGGVIIKKKDDYLYIIFLSGFRLLCSGKVIKK
jgi:hypothetical protein